MVKIDEQGDLSPVTVDRRAYNYAQGEIRLWRSAAIVALLSASMYVSYTWGYNQGYGDRVPVKVTPKHNSQIPPS